MKREQVLSTALQREAILIAIMCIMDAMEVGNGYALLVIVLFFFGTTIDLATME